MKLEKIAKINLERSMQHTLLDVSTAMFKWEGLPKYIRPEYIELYLRTTGSCAIIKRDAMVGASADKIPADWEYCLTQLDRGGAPDVYGEGTAPIFVTLNGYAQQLGTAVDNIVYDGYDNPIAIICQGNNTQTPDPFWQIGANLLTESLTSLVQNIIHSRYSPMLAVSDENVKRSVEKAMNDIISGKTVVVASQNLLQELESGLKACEPVPLTDVEKQQFIQYISKSIDDIIRWYCTINGQAVQGNGKLAQQTVDEVNGSTSASFILPELGWRWRQQFCEELKLIGLDGVTVSYNKPWAVEVEKYTEDIEDTEVREEMQEDDPAEAEEDPAEEPEEEQKEEQEEEANE